VRKPPEYSAQALLIDYVQHQFCDVKQRGLHGLDDNAARVHIRDPGALALLSDPRIANAIPSQHVALVARSVSIITPDIAEAFLSVVLLGGDAESYVRAHLIRPELL